MDDFWTNERVSEAMKALAECNYSTPVSIAMGVDFASALAALGRRNSKVQLLSIKLEMLRKVVLLAQQWIAESGGPGTMAQSLQAVLDATEEDS